MLADSAWNRCGVLPHSGSLLETVAVAQAAMLPLETAMLSPSEEELALWGALNLRCTIAMARRGEAREADSYLAKARDAARRLPVGYVDLKH